MNSKLLEERLIDFSVSVIDLSKIVENSYVGQYITQQLVPSSISPALNYGEARSAESIKDFIHKLKIVIKELRETHVSLKIIQKANLTKEVELLSSSERECNELISIFVTTIKSCQKKIYKSENP